MIRRILSFLGLCIVVLLLIIYVFGGEIHLKVDESPQKIEQYTDKIFRLLKGFGGD